MYKSSQDEALSASWGALFRDGRAPYAFLINLGIFLYGTDIFVINTLMPTIVADIGGIRFYAWATMLFLVGSIMGSASYDPLRTSRGGRSAYVLGGGVFLAGAITCSLAPMIAVLLIGRLVQGFGAGLLISGSMALISSLFQAQLRSRAIALSSITWILSALVGPLYAGTFAEMGWWREAFWLYVPVIAVFVGGVLYKLPGRDDGVPSQSGRRRFPLATLLLLGSAVLCVGLAGQVAGDAIRIALIPLALVVAWLAFARDADGSNRLFPSEPLSFSGSVGLAYWSHLLVAAVFTTIGIYLPLVLQVVHGVTPLFVGFMNALLSMGWSVTAALVAGWHGGRERKAVVAGPICMLLGCLGLAIATSTNSSLFHISAFALLVGAGIGLFYAHMTSMLMSSARPGEESITASSLPTIRSLGMAFGAALASTIANLGGLEAEVTADIVRGAVTWVYVFDLFLMTATIIVVLRFFGPKLLTKGVRD